MAVEFLPWYKASERLLRCGGDDGCGALLMDGDTELHQKWHDKIDPPIEVYVVPPDPSKVFDTLAKRDRTRL